jgi:hypothetical protein
MRDTEFEPRKQQSKVTPVGVWASIEGIDPIVTCWVNIGKARRKSPRKPNEGSAIVMSASV